MDQSLQAIRDAHNIQAPSSPLGSFPELQQFYRIGFQLPQSMGGLSSLTARDQQAEEQRQRDAAVAKEAAINKLKQEMQNTQDAVDPKNFRKVQKEDGGYDFFDGAGHKISIQQYAQATGQRPTKILSDSENSLDRQYLADYKNLNELLNATAQNDTKKLESMYKENPGLKDSIQGLKPDDLIRQFRQAYPNIYQTDNVNANPTGNVRSMGTQLFQGQKRSGINFGDILKSIFSIFG